MIKFLLSLLIVINFLGCSDEEFKESDILYKSRNFKFNKLEKANFAVTATIKEENNGYIQLDFFRESIKTKNIRDFIEFTLQDIEYTYKVSEDKLTIYGDFKPNEKYSLKLKKGFIAGSKKVKQDLFLIVSFSNLDKILRFKNDKSYISSHTEAIEVESTNIDKVEVDIYKINAENINYLNIFQSNILNSNYYISQALDEYSEKITSYKKVIAKENNKKLSTFLNFNDSLKYKDDGIYALTIKDNSGMKDSKLIYKSDLGISTKVSSNQLFLSLRSLASSESIAGAEIYLYSKKNKLITSGKTNMDGIFIKEYKNLIDAQPKLIIAKKNNQINFLDLDEAISDYDILKDYSVKTNDEYKALVFMERTLLRPNDKVNMLITVKDKSFKSLKDKNIYLKILDPKSKVISEDTLKLNNVGAVEYQYTSYNDNKTGKYRLIAYLGDEQIGSKEFYVEAFIPEKIEVNIESSKDKILVTDNIDFTIKSKYLIGVPAKNLKYNFEAVVRPSSYKSVKFKNFIFSDQLNEQKNLISQNINESGTLNEIGAYYYNIKIPIDKTSYSALDTSLLATVFDDGRPVRKYKSLTIFPYNEVVGVKKLFTGNMKARSTGKFKSIIIDPLNDKEVNTTQKLNVKIFKKFWHYYAEDEIREIESFEVSSDEDIEFTPNKGGQYYMSISTENGQTSTLDFYVSWWGNEPSNLKDKSSYKVALKTNKEVYQHGDTISLDLKSPITGTLLLTIEEDGIVDYMVFNLHSNTSNFDFVMPKEIKKGAYIKAHVVRSTKDSDEIFPYRVIGSTFIKKDNSKFNSNATITLKKLHSSKDEIRVKIKASQSKSSYAVVSLVDKGILNIIDEKNTDAFDFYDKQEKSKVSLYDLYSNLQQHILLQSQSVSGDGIAKKRKKFNSPDAINERVKPVSFWSEIVKLDENNEAEVSFKTTNFNGKLRAQVLVVDDTTISSDTKYTIIKDDIVIKPTLPRFFTQDDKVLIPLRLMNTTSSQKDVKLEIVTTKNLFSRTNEKTISIDAKSSFIEGIQIEALKPGLSKILFKVSVDNNEFLNETSIYVKDKHDYKVISEFGILDENSKANIQVITEDMKSYNTPVKVYLSIDNTPFASLSKSYKYLIGYPYGCAEQTSSKVLAMLVSKKFIDKDDKTSFALREKYIKEGINKLVSMQKNSGEFSYWPGRGYVNYYSSFYTMYVLQLTKDFGFDVPEIILSKALKANWRNFNSNLSGLDFFMAYADEKTANKLYDNKEYGNTLTSYVALAAAMKRVGNIEESKKLIDEANKVYHTYDRDRVRSYRGSFYSPIKDFASSLFLYKKFINKNLEDIFSKELIRTILTYIKSDKLYSTQDKAFAMLAVSTYYQNIDTSKSKVNVIATYNNELENIDKKLFKEIVLDKSDSIGLKNSGSIVHYTVDINKPVDLPVNNLDSNTNAPIVIKSNYVDENGKLIDVNNIELGQKLYIEVELSSNKRIENVAVTIKIPAGFEILNKRLFKDGNHQLKTESYSPDYEDYRDDRFLTFLTTNITTTKFNIPVSAVTKGTFTNPASYIEAMYDSRINNYYKAHKTVTIK